MTLCLQTEIFMQCNTIIYIGLMGLKLSVFCLYKINKIHRLLQHKKTGVVISVQLHYQQTPVWQAILIEVVTINGSVLYL